MVLLDPRQDVQDLGIQIALGRVVPLHLPGVVHRLDLGLGYLLGREPCGERERERRGGGEREREGERGGERGRGGRIGMIETEGLLIE
jgi:hypothetical protein